MKHNNVEIKARCRSLASVRAILKDRDANFKGRDHQVDTYFDSPTGRLKLREGLIEKSLIYYERRDEPGPSVSRVTRCDTEAVGPGLKEVLSEALPIITVVDKHREIYFVDNVKIHLDVVESLGSYVEIEAIDLDGTRGLAGLELQCQDFVHAFEIDHSDLVHESYSDMMLRNRIPLRKVS